MANCLPGQLLVICLVILGEVFGKQNSQCILRDGQCTYHVYLDNLCNSGGEGRIGGQEDKDNSHNGVQNDKVQIMNQIQKNLVNVKSDHNRRIEALENKILSLEKKAAHKIREKLETSTELEQPVVSPPSTEKHSAGLRHLKKISTPKTSAKEVLAKGGTTSLDASGEKHLLDILHIQFTELRTRLRALKSQLRFKDSRLNETSVRLNKTQEELLAISKKLVKTEGKLFDVEIANSDLRTALEDKEQQLNRTQEKLEETTQQLRKTQLEQSITLSNLAKSQKDLELQKRLLKSARQHLQRALIKYHDLNVENEKTNQALKTTEQELVDCYKGKTSQFCGFEDETICGFIQENDTDYFNWSRGNEETPSSRTGPRFDHTCGNKNGYYMYIEASGKGSNQNARLISPKYRSFSAQCVEFYYHMYGTHIGTLNVYTQIPDQDVAPVWRAFGDQGDFWSMARLPVAKEEATKSFQVVFEAILEPGYAGDIAIDDFRVFDGECYHVMTAEDYARQKKFSLPVTTPTTAGQDVSNTIGKT